MEKENLALRPKAHQKFFVYLLSSHTDIQRRGGEKPYKVNFAPALALNYQFLQRFSSKLRFQNGVHIICLIIRANGSSTLWTRKSSIPLNLRQINLIHQRTLHHFHLTHKAASVYLPAPIITFVNSESILRLNNGASTDFTRPHSCIS